MLAQLHSSPIPSANIPVAEERDGKGPSQQFLTASSQLLQPLLNATGKVQRNGKPLQLSAGKTKLPASMVVCASPTTHLTSTTLTIQFFHGKEGCVWIKVRGKINFKKTNIKARNTADI